MHKNILILIVLSTTLFSAVNYEEIVYLKDGSEIHGVIIEQVPNQYIKIKSGKNIFVYQIDEIEKITKSEIKESDSYYDNSYEKTKGTEDWYFTFGLGPSLTNNTIFDDSDVSSIGMNILGFYWHNSPKSILGFSISGKGDRYEIPYYYYYSDLIFE